MGVLGLDFSKIRFLNFLRSKKPVEVARQPIFLSVFSANADEALRAYVERSFAFSPSSERLSFARANSDIELEKIAEIYPSRVLFVNCSPSKPILRTLKNIDVPHSVVRIDLPSENAEIDARQFAQRGGISEVVGRRNSVYVHKPNKRHLPVVINAFLDAKRQYPDLLLMLSGVHERDIESLGLDISIIHEDANKSLRQLGDVLISDQAEFLPNWAGSANLCVLLPENKNIFECAQIALGSGASLLTYQVELEKFETLSELEAIGAVWSAQRPNLLAAAMTQALSPEKTALTVGQSLERLTANEDQLSQVIDALLDRE